MVPVLTAAGLRAVAPDLVGFGRSDKPTPRSEYTFARHVEWMRSLLFDALDVSGVTLVCQDWGGLIGLRLVAEHPGRFDRVVAANTFLPTGDGTPSKAFLGWLKFSQEVETFPDRRHRQRRVHDRPHCGGRGGLRRTFPDQTFTEGARQFPTLVPISPEDPASSANRAAWKVLAGFDKPFLTAFSDGDPITAGSDRVLQERIPGAAGQHHVTIAGGGHFLQEDRGPELARVVVDFVNST